MPQRPTYAQAVAGAALNAQVRKQQLTECAQNLLELRTPSDGMCLWHSAAGAPQDGHRDAAHRASDPAQRAQQTAAAMRAAEPFMRALGCWNDDAPERGDRW